MKILMFSWEYPPVSYGGLARHVQDLSESLVEMGNEVYIITQGDHHIPGQETMNGVEIIRTNPISISANNFVDNILHLNFELVEKGIKLVNEIGQVDLIHGHDWLVFWASRVLKHALVKPLIYTIHATEFGRNQGIYNEMQRYINDIEWYATFEAWKVIVCSQYMKQEVNNLFQLPEDKIIMIPNGVKEENYQTEYSDLFRQKYASPDEKMVFYVGRIVREKGIQILIQAIPEILSVKPSTKFVIAGKGPFVNNLKAQASYLGVDDRIYFTGFISDETRNKLYRSADAAVFPSLYEPFGIVALEAMVTKTPVVVSQVGGLVEFVHNRKNGLTVNPGDASGLAQALTWLFDHPAEAEEIAEQGYQMVREQYSWKQIAQETLQVYKQVLAEYQQSNWHEHENDVQLQDEDSLAYKYLMQKKYSTHK